MWYIYRSNCGILVASLFYVEKYLKMLIAQGIKKKITKMYPQPLPRMASILKYLYLKAPKCVFFLAIFGAGGGGWWGRSTFITNGSSTMILCLSRLF